MATTKGCLRLHVIEAVLDRDIGTADDLVMDPYVVISNKQNAARTTAKEDAGRNPVWNEVIELEVNNISDDIHLRVMDENVGANCEIGCCSIKLAAMCTPGGLEDWWGIAFGNKKAGRIHLRGEWVNGSADPVAAQSERMLTITQPKDMTKNFRLSAQVTGPQVNNYAMPSYNHVEPFKMQQPAWADRQYKDMNTIQQRGFMRSGQ